MNEIRRKSRFEVSPATCIIGGAIVVGLLIEIATGAWTNPETLVMLGSVQPTLIRSGEWWRLLTAMFLHGDGTIPMTIAHAAVNLFSLFQLGSLYEAIFGTRRFVIIYFVAGIIASLASFLTQPPFGSSVGASGAIFGILGAFIFSIRRSRWRDQRWARSLVGQCVFWALANIALAYEIPNIDQAAHVGGLIAGLILGAALPQREPPPPPSTTTVDINAF